MGMLQLAGMVSGFGKGVGRGLENMQNTMSSMQLLEIRNEMDRARQRETWGHEEGVIQRQHKWDEARDDKKFSQQLELKEDDQDFQASQARIGREEGRQKEERDAVRQAAQEEQQQKNRISELVAKEGYSQQAAERKAAAEFATEKFKAKEAEKERNFKFGADVQLKKLEGQNKEHTGAAKLDPTTGATLKVYTDRIGRLEDEMNNVMTKEARRAEILKEIAALEGKQNALLGMPSTQRERPGYKFPD